MDNPLGSNEIGLVKSEPIKKIKNFHSPTASRLQNLAALPISSILGLFIPYLVLKFKFLIFLFSTGFRMPPRMPDGNGKLL